MRPASTGSVPCTGDPASWQVSSEWSSCLRPTEVRGTTSQLGAPRMHPEGCGSDPKVGMFWLQEGHGVDIHSCPLASLRLTGKKKGADLASSSWERCPAPPGWPLGTKPAWRWSHSLRPGLEDSSLLRGRRGSKPPRPSGLRNCRGNSGLPVVVRDGAREHQGLGRAGSHVGQPGETRAGMTGGAGT